MKRRLGLLSAVAACATISAVAAVAPANALWQASVTTDFQQSYQMEQFGFSVERVMYSPRVVSEDGQAVLLSIPRSVYDDDGSYTVLVRVSLEGVAPVGAQMAVEFSQLSENRTEDGGRIWATLVPQYDLFETCIGKNPCLVEKDQDSPSRQDEWFVHLEKMAPPEEGGVDQYSSTVTVSGDSEAGLVEGSTEWNAQLDSPIDTQEDIVVSFTPVITR